MTPPAGVVTTDLDGALVCRTSSTVTNAHPEVIAVADHRCESNAADGVA